MLIIQTLLTFTILLGILIFVHELGHFIAARLIGVTVEEFALGFGKKVWSKKIGDTVYRINFIPFGGYVKLLGEEDRSHDPKSFSQKSIGARALVLFAGVFMNFLFGVFIFYIFLASSSYQVAVVNLVNYPFIGLANDDPEKEIIIVQEIVEDSPLKEFDIEAGSLLTHIDDTEITSAVHFQSLLQEKAGSESVVTLLGLNNEEIEYTIQLHANEDSESGIIGVVYVPFKIYNLDYTGSAAYSSGLYHSINMLGYQLFAFGNLIQESFRSQTIEPIASNVTGVVGLAEQTYQISKLGEARDVLNLLGVVSIMLAFMNILPIPVLDGGHVAFLLLEKIRGRKVAERYEVWANKIGFIFLIGLTILITVKDFIQFDILQRLWGLIT